MLRVTPTDVDDDLTLRFDCISLDCLVNADVFI